jgi:hypothetical protein
LLEVGLQRRLLGPLLLYCPVARGALLLDSLLARILLHRKPEPYEGQREGDYQ